MPAVSIPPSALINALNLATPPEKPASPNLVVTSSPNEEWEKGLSLEEKKAIYKEARKNAGLNERSKFLSRKEFDSIDGFRSFFSEDTNRALRRNLQDAAARDAESTVNSGLQKLGELGCRSYGLEYRGINYKSMKRLETSGKGIRGKQSYTDPGIPFFTPDKDVGFTYTFSDSDSTGPGTLMHVMGGGSGTYSFNPHYPDIIFYPSKTKFHNVIDGLFNEERNIYTPVLEDPRLPANAGKDHYRDLLITPSQPRHIDQINKVVFNLDSNGRPLSPTTRLQKNLAMAMLHISPYELQEIIQVFIQKTSLAEFKNNFPHSFQKQKKEANIRASLAPELDLVLPGALGDNLVKDLSKRNNARSISMPLAQLLKNESIDAATKEKIVSKSGGVPGKVSVPARLYREMKTRSLIEASQSQGNSDAENKVIVEALAEKINRLYSTITATDLEKNILPYMEAEKLDLLNNALEKQFSRFGKDLLQRQRDVLPQHIDQGKLGLEARTPALSSPSPTAQKASKPQATQSNNPNRDGGQASSFEQRFGLASLNRMKNRVTRKIRNLAK